MSKGIRYRFGVVCVIHTVLCITCEGLWNYMCACACWFVHMCVLVRAQVCDGLCTCTCWFVRMYVLVCAQVCAVNRRLCCCTGALAGIFVAETSHGNRIGTPLLCGRYTGVYVYVCVFVCMYMCGILHLCSVGYTGVCVYVRVCGGGGGLCAKESEMAVSPFGDIAVVAHHNRRHYFIFSRD